jgi:hypothetical protein
MSPRFNLDHPEMAKLQPGALPQADMARAFGAFKFII